VTTHKPEKTKTSATPLWLDDIIAKDKNNFDFLRLMAASAVVISHAFYLATGYSENEPLATTSVYSLGQHAVNLFFFLSGLLVAASLDRSSSAGDFLLKRALRVFPGLIVCILLTVLIGAFVTELSMGEYLSSPRTILYVLQTVSLSTGLAQLPGVFESLPVKGLINIPLWSLKYEILCYLALALIAACNIWKRDFLFGCIVGALFLLYLLAETKHASVKEHVLIDQILRFGVCFFLGTVAFKFRRLIPLSLPVAVAVLILLIGTRSSRLEEFISYIAIGYFALSFAALPVSAAKRFTNHADLSYGIYIYGWPAGQLLLHFTGGMQSWALAGASLLLAGLLAYLSWIFVERPAMTLKRQ
jgi:peptidoglycan/LPS O-acetylase OafA/YrhL